MTEPPVPYPAFLDLRDRLVVIVGDGMAAERKAHAMLKYGADIAVIGPSPTPGLIEAEADGLLTVEQRPYHEGDLAGAALVICVDTDEVVRGGVFAECDSRGCPVSTPGAPELSTFSTPSAVRRGALQIAVSTGGRAPEVARQVRAALKEEYGEEWAEYVQLMAELRESVAERSPAADRRAVIEAVAASDVLQRIRDGEAPTVDDLYREFVPAVAESPRDADVRGDTDIAGSTTVGPTTADPTIAESTTEEEAGE